jgi:hypothetical protein
VDESDPGDTDDLCLRVRVPGGEGLAPMSHFDWDELDRLTEGDPLMLRDLTWGLVMALENVIKSIDQLRAVTPDEESNLSLFKIQNQVLNSWLNARKTLDHLNKIKKETP